MKKVDFVRNIAEATGYTMKSVGEILDAMNDTVRDVVKEQDKVAIFEGLIVEGSMVDESTKRNPLTGEPIVVPAHIKPKARFTDKFKQSLKG